MAKMRGVALRCRWITWAMFMVPVWSPSSHQGGILPRSLSPSGERVRERGAFSLYNASSGLMEATWSPIDVSRRRKSPPPPQTAEQGGRSLPLRLDISVLKRTQKCIHNIRIGLPGRWQKHTVRCVLIKKKRGEVYISPSGAPGHSTDQYHSEII